MLSSEFTHKNGAVLQISIYLNIKMITRFIKPWPRFHLHSAIAMTSAQTKYNPNVNINNGIRSLCKHGHFKEALNILNNAAQDNNIVSSVYVSLMQACIQNKSDALPYAKLIHAHIHLKGFMFNKSVGNTLVSMYAKCGSLAEAQKVFEEMPYRDVCSWSIMISAYSAYGLRQEALELFHRMRKTGLKPNHFTFASIIPVCASLGCLEEGKEIHEEIKGLGFERDQFVGNALVDFYAKCGSLEDACKVFDKMPQRDKVSWTVLIRVYVQKGRIKDALELFDEIPQRDLWSWTVMIEGLAKNGLLEEALKFFRQMKHSGIQPNEFTFLVLLRACSDLCSVEEGVGIHSFVIRSGLQSNVLVTNALIDMYAKCGRVELARYVFDKMPDRDLISWTTIIVGYTHSGLPENALDLFKQMQKCGPKPDGKTFTSILSACANLGALEQGMEIHQEMITRGIQSDSFVVSALIDMYAKCGSLLKARELFDELHPRDVVSWTAMIAGYAMHGCAREAIKLFEEMTNSGISPNHVTLTCALTACCHAGLVEEGRQYFNSMSDYYDITPKIDHYSCMVDLLGRAGHLDEAKQFINIMPITPDSSVWNSLLSACRLHGNIELGEYAAARILELEPQSPAPYVLLSNMYAENGRWIDFDKVWKMMRDKESKKTAACSWIEVNTQVHPFLIGTM